MSNYFNLRKIIILKLLFNPIYFVDGIKYGNKFNAGL